MFLDCYILFSPNTHNTWDHCEKSMNFRGKTIGMIIDPTMVPSHWSNDPSFRSSKEGPGHLQWTPAALRYLFVDFEYSRSPFSFALIL